MKIVDVQAELYSKPYDTPISNGKYTYYAAKNVLVRVTTDEGITGVGWCGAGGIGEPKSKDVIVSVIEDMKQVVLGEDPFNVERIWDNLYKPKLWGRKGLTTRAISAIDIALWDVMAQALEQPLYRLLGGYTDEVKCYIAGGYYAKGKGLKELAAEMESYVAQGAKAVKMKVGAVPLRADEKRVQAVRKAIGDGVDLLVDANNAYVAADAVRMAKILETYDTYWFEEPVSPDNMRGSAEVARSTPVPVAAGENEYTRWGFRELFESGAVDIVNPDAMVLGGITEYRKVAALAAAYEIPIAPHGLQEVHVHLLAAFPLPLILEYYNPNVAGLNAVMFHERLQLTDKGTVKVPQGPGLGVSVNWAALAPYKVE
ncbi:MAG: mandelate racemase/muconate lactonizing enzyme family protein [Actinobacteria bacterium]|nr:mandelate racemase/muconate lactonizing enzyme family protein [Actinomycetota bacterium]